VDVSLIGSLDVQLTSASGHPRITVDRYRQRDKVRHLVYHVRTTCILSNPSHKPVLIVSRVVFDLRNRQITLGNLRIMSTAARRRLMRDFKVGILDGGPVASSFNN
jgi:hypothetical protein